MPSHTIIELIVSAVFAILGAILAENLSPIIGPFARRSFGLKSKEKQTFGERLAELTKSLASASAEVDKVIQEMASVARERQEAVSKLEQNVLAKEQRESELQSRIDMLEKTPLPVAEHFASLLKSTEQKNTRRDYLLFGVGVVVTTAIAIAFQLFGH